MKDYLLTPSKELRNPVIDDSDLVDSLIILEGNLPHPLDIGDGKITLGSGLTDPRWIELYRKRGNKWSKEDNRMAVETEVADRRKWAKENFPNWEYLPSSSQKALLSYKYNYDFNKNNSPKLWKAAQAMNWEEVANQMDATSKNPKLKKGLETRREREQNWFRSGLRDAEFSQMHLRPIQPSVLERAKNKLMETLGIADRHKGSWAYGGSLSDKEEKAMRYFMDRGFARHQAAGLVGNLIRESGLNPEIVNKSSGAYGIAQWLGPRKKKLFAKYGNKPTFEQQLEFVYDELNNTHKSGLKHLLASKDAEEAARMGMGYYEFQAGPEGAIAAMNKWGQDGEGSMRKGIENALRLMGNPADNRREEIYSKYGNYEETPVFMPRNPQAFFAPISTYSRPVVVSEPVNPIVKQAEELAARRAAREEEARQRAQGLNLLMGLIGGNSNNGYLGMLSNLSGLGLP